MADFRGSSSDIFSDEVDSISIREKALLKRSVSKHHNNNFKAGYVPVHEQHLTKTGLRGRKTFAFWTLVALLFILAVGNLVLTVTILGVLRLGQGMESIELVPEEFAVKFFGETDLGHMYKRDGKIEGFKDEPVEISGEESAVLLNLSSRNGRPSTKVKINKTGTHFRFESFSVKNRHGDVVFSTDEPHFRSLKGANVFSAKTVMTDRIVTPVNSKLKIEGRLVTLKGSEGTTMDGKEIIWSADQDVYLKTENNGSILLSGSDGTWIDVKRIPIVAAPRKSNHLTSQYKVCVCMPEGKLFRVPVPTGSNLRVYCHHINSHPNPCI